MRLRFQFIYVIIMCMKKRDVTLNPSVVTIRKRRWRMLIFALALLLIIPTTAALANSLPPPFQIFLRFIPADNTSHSIDGVQLVGCEDSSCSAPQTLAQFGACTAPGFLNTPPVLPESWRLECAGTRCLFESDFHEIKTLPPYLQVITLQADQGRASQVFQSPDCDYCTIAWKVDLSESELAVVVDEEFVDPDRAYREFFLTYLFTVLVELLVAAVFIMIFRKSIKVTAKKLILTTLLANLLSYPISWLVIPAFGQFQADFYRRVSIMVIVTVVIVTVASILLQKKRGKLKRGTIIALIVAIPVCAVLFLIGMFASSYGNYRVHVSGLPWSVVVILAETFAVIFESFVLSTLLRPELSFKKALLLSLVTNAASFLLGLLLF